MARRWPACFAALALVGCGTRDAGPAPVIETGPAACAIGERPDYFVPGGGVLLGCARLAVSGKRVEFSGGADRIGRGRHACISPAYGAHGNRGAFIPALCKLAPPLQRFAVRDAREPQQGVRGYGFVIWGTAGTSTDVVARFAGGTARAAVFDVAPRLARRLGEPPFSLFVVEVPRAAASYPITVVARDLRLEDRV